MRIESTLFATWYIYRESREDWFIKGTEAKKDVMIMRDIIKGEAREGRSFLNTRM